MRLYYIREHTALLKEVIKYMQAKEIIDKDVSPHAPKEPKAYETPELKQLGSFEELTLRKRINVSVPG
jgi:hypothetical protein